MTLNNLPKITSEIRIKLLELSERRYQKIKNDINYMLYYSPGKYAEEFLGYDGVFDPKKNNIVCDSDKKPMMEVYTFDIREQIELMRILQIANKTTFNIIKVFSNTTVPMHIDLNKGAIGRDNLIWNTVLSGEDGWVYMSNTKDGSKQIAIPGKTQYIFSPTEIIHGAQAGAEPYIVLQMPIGHLT